MGEQQDIPAGTKVRVEAVGGRPIPFEIHPTQPVPSENRDDQLWPVILDRTKAISFDELEKFISKHFCGNASAKDFRTDCGESRQLARPNDPFSRIDGYQRLKTAIEVFLTVRCGVVLRKYQHGKPKPSSSSNSDPAPDYEHEDASSYLQDSVLPYLYQRVRTLFPDKNQEEIAALSEESPLCKDILVHRFKCPCMLELIWSYWHEEGMLVQTMNAIGRRFENRGSGLPRDPLARLTLAPIRQASNLFWGYVQDDMNRLTVKRRAFEYDHEYGLRLQGKAVEDVRTVDSRSKFIEGFHSLLQTAVAFYKQHDNTMVVADAFPVLNALKEVHLLLAQGAHNQFGDLPWTARAEMLLQQWLLARPEMREFLGGRPMMPYSEGWMAHVDTIKSLYGWSDVSVTHFHDLAVFGEQLLLSIRYADWSNVHDANNAKNWAVFWRPQIQGYMHAYRVVTGVDLTDMTSPVHVERRFIQPSVLLTQRLAAQTERR
jgi:hypothetical protein